MSALGQKQTCAPQKAMSALPPIATAKADWVQEARYRRRDRQQDAQGARPPLRGARGRSRRSRGGGGRFPAGARIDPCPWGRFRRHSAVRHSTTDRFCRRTSEGFATTRCCGRAAALLVIHRGHGHHRKGWLETVGGALKLSLRPASNVAPLPLHSSADVKAAIGP